MNSVWRTSASLVWATDRGAWGPLTSQAYCNPLLSPSLLAGYLTVHWSHYAINMLIKKLIKTRGEENLTRGERGGLQLGQD